MVWLGVVWLVLLGVCRTQALPYARVLMVSPNGSGRVLILVLPTAHTVVCVLLLILLRATPHTSQGVSVRVGWRGVWVGV